MVVWLVAYLEQVTFPEQGNCLKSELEEKIFNKESLVGIFNSIYKLQCKQLLGLVLKNVQLTNRDFFRHQKSRKFSKLRKKIVSECSSYLPVDSIHIYWHELMVINVLQV